MKIGAVIQARMTSTRLPGKVLMEVLGKPLLARQLERLGRCTSLDALIVATTVNRQDDPVEDLSASLGLPCCRGSEYDVLSRYYDCATAHGLDAVVRLTADCPLMDPAEVDRVVDLFRQGGADYVNNVVPLETRTAPDGMDVEVFTYDLLARAQREAASAAEREHVTLSFGRLPGVRARQLRAERDCKSYRLTLDYPEDLEVIAFVLAELERRGQFGSIKEVVAILDDHPEIRAKNAAWAL